MYVCNNCDSEFEEELEYCENCGVKFEKEIDIPKGVDIDVNYARYVDPMPRAFLKHPPKFRPKRTGRIYPLGKPRKSQSTLV